MNKPLKSTVFYMSYENVFFTSFSGKSEFAYSSHLILWLHRKFCSLNWLTKQANICKTFNNNKKNMHLNSGY